MLAGREPRTLDAWSAFAMGMVGLGFLYVGWDSRLFGPISRQQLIGRAEYTVFSRRRLAPLPPQ
jgi:type IV secretory pathway protease TraF